GGIGLDAYRRLLSPADGNQAHPGKLRDLLSQSGVRQVLHFGERQRSGGQAESEDGSVSWIYLAVDGRVGQVAWQIGSGRIDGCLYLLLRDVNVLRQIELQRDDGASERTGGGHLTQAGHLSELTLQGRRDRGGHDLGIGSGVKRHDL